MDTDDYQKKSNPCSLEHLVDSHFILLRLVNETNEVLGGMIGSYFDSALTWSRVSIV